MNKEDLIVEIQATAKERGIELSKKDTATVLESVLDSLVEGVKREGKVQLVGYFGLTIEEVAERQVPVEVGNKEKGTKTKPACQKIKIKLGKNFKL